MSASGEGLPDTGGDGNRAEEARGRVVLLTGERGTGKSTACLKVARRLQAHYGRQAVAGVVTLRGGSGSESIRGTPPADAGIEVKLRSTGFGPGATRGVDPRSALLLPEGLQLPLAAPVRHVGGCAESPGDSAGGREGADSSAGSVGRGGPADGPRVGPRLGPFEFFQETIDRVNTLFAPPAAARAATSDRNRRSPSAPLVWILDEVGPLELKRGEGFLPALEALERALAGGGAGGARGAATSGGAAAGSGVAGGLVDDGAAPLRAIVVVRPSLVEDLRLRLTERPAAGPVRTNGTPRAAPPIVHVHTLTETSRDEAPAELLRLL